MHYLGMFNAPAMVGQIANYFAVDVEYHAVGTIANGMRAHLEPGLPKVVGFPSEMNGVVQHEPVTEGQYIVVGSKQARASRGELARTVKV